MVAFYVWSKEGLQFTDLFDEYIELDKKKSNI